MLDVDKLYSKYQGQTLDYDGVAADAGQCVQWVEYALTDTQYGYGLQPFWGNAIDWWNNYGGSLTAFDKITDGSIKKGDIVIFNTLVGSQFGHIDLAAADGTTADFQGYDSNWGGNKTVHPVHHVGSQYVIGSLRLKGGTMDGVTLQVARIVAFFILGRNGVTNPINALNGDCDDDLKKGIGQPLNTAYITALYNSAECKAFLNKLGSLNSSVNKTEVLDYINKHLS